MNLTRHVSVAFGLAAACLGLAGCHGGSAADGTAKPPSKAVPVTVEPVTRRPVERTVEVVGTLRGWESVSIGSKKMGRVTKVRRDMGDRVKPGEPIVELEMVDADLAVQQAEKRLLAELAKLGLKEMPKAEFDVTTIPAAVQAKVALERARQNLARERALMQRNAGSTQDYQNAENDEAAADAAYENAVLTARSTLAGALASKVALDVATQSRMDMEIRAPVPSDPPVRIRQDLTYAVAKRSVSEGQMLREGEPIADLVIENPLRLWMNVPERFSADVSKGQDVRISVASFPGKDFLGVVTRINPSVDSVSRTFQVEASVPNDDGKLRPGGFAKASIIVAKASSAVTVPLESVIRYAGVTKIFVVSDGKTAREVKIETGLEGQGWVEVLGTIPAESQVVTTGQTQLAEGSLVLVKEPAKAEAKEAAKPAAEGVGG